MRPSVLLTMAPVRLKSGALRILSWHPRNKDCMDSSLGETRMSSSTPTLSTVKRTTSSTSGRDRWVGVSVTRTKAASLVPRPHPAHTRRRGLVSQVHSLVPRPRAPPGEKRSGERSQIPWAYYPKRVMTNDIARSVIITLHLA